LFNLSWILGNVVFCSYFFSLNFVITLDLYWFRLYFETNLNLSWVSISCRLNSFTRYVGLISIKFSTILRLLSLMRSFSLRRVTIFRLFGPGALFITLADEMMLNIFWSKMLFSFSISLSRLSMFYLYLATFFS